MTKISLLIDYRPMETNFLPSFLLPWEVWLLAAVLLAIAELMVPSFSFIFLSFGALCATVGAFFGLELRAAVGVFAASSLISLALLRPFLHAKFGKKSTHILSRTDVLVGKSGVVTVAITGGSTAAGRVEVQGEDWAAVGAESLATNTKIQVESADGIVLTVRRS